MPRCLFVASTLSAALALALLGRAQEVDLAAREWSGPWGGGARSAFVDVEPVRGEPVLLWERAHDALVAGPVTFGGTLYAVVREGRVAKLRAFELTSGAEQGFVLVTEAEPLELHAAPGVLALCGPGGTTTYVHRGTTIRKAKFVKEAKGGGGVGGGFLFTASGHALDLERGKIVASWPTSGRPYVFSRADGSWLVATLHCGSRPGYGGSWVRLGLREARARDGGLELAGGSSLIVGPLRRADQCELDQARLLPVEHKYRTDWFASGLPRLNVRHDASFGAILFGENGELGVAPLSTPGVRCGRQFIGFGEDGGLIGVSDTARWTEILPPDGLPRGARPSAPTAARGVVYLGNWAVEAAGRRVLWSREDLPAGVPAIPAGDGLLLYASAKGLACYTDGAAQPAATARAARPLRPDAGSGVVTEDGRVLAGRVELLAGGGAKLAGPEGELVLAAEELALIVAEESVELRGEPAAVHRAFEQALSLEHRERLTALFDRYLEPRLLEDCRRLVDEAGDFGLEDGERRALFAKLGGVSRTRAANAERQAERIAREERAAREASLSSWLAAATWCRERGLGLVASALAARAERVLADDPRPAELAESLVPPEFPWRGAEDAGRRWLRFGPALLPSNASFVGADDPLRARLEGTVWETRSLLLRSSNLTFTSRVEDPEIVGTCLRNAERAIRALESLLGAGGRAELEDHERLDVRLHKTKKDYLGEPLGEGHFANPWSVGFYVPSQGISRFHLPDKERTLDPLGRDLFAVVAHELTHHWLDLHWREPLGIGPGPDPLRPGFWIVEGIARFVEDQVLESDRRGFAFDDRTVRSLDACAQLEAGEALLPARLFVDLSQEGFHGLEAEPKAVVRLRNTLAAMVLSELNVFYEQAGALCFFLANERGPEGRERLLAYLREVYSGEAEEKGWERLGFDTPEELDLAFHAFLRSLRE